MLNVTDLASYLFCSRKLYLTKVLKLEEPVKEAMMLGTIRHAVYDALNKAEEQLVTSVAVPMELPELITHYTTTYSKLLRTAIMIHKHALKRLELDLQETFVQQWKYVQREATFRAAVLSSFIAEQKVYGQELWEQVTPKIQSEIRVLSEQLQLKGIVDQIEVHQDHIVPIELKTGSMAPLGIWPRHKIQLSAYMVLLAKQWDKPVKEGKIRYLDHDKEKILSFNSFYEQEIQDMVAAVTDVLSSKIPPGYIDNKNKCVNCSLKEKCYDPELIAQKVKTLAS